MNNLSTPNISETPVRRLLHPLSWSQSEQIAAVLALLAGVWAIFRPDRILVNKTIDDQLPEGEQHRAPELLGTGKFWSLGHIVTGQASLYRGGEGFVLRLDDGFSAHRAPDVHVYLVQGESGADSTLIKAGKFLDVGSIKGNKGSQNYPLPADFDPDKYGAVSIWCKRFGVNFGAATLGQPGEH